MIRNVKKFPKNPGVYPAPFRNKRLSRDVLKLVPKRCGVYFFRDKNRRVLYIGKAANLKSRLKSYFDKTSKNPRFQKMLETAKSVDWQETNSEIEALILESQLIKKFRPSFNIMLRDDKQYFFVVFTKEKFPKIFITHQPTNQEKIRFSQTIGPFTDGAALRVTLKLLRRMFPYCTCKQKHNNYCLNYHIGNCPGFCCLKESRIRNLEAKSKEYRKNIKAVSEVLSGKKLSVIKRFEKEMNSVARNGDFEKAVELRDKIEKLKRVLENVRIINEIGRREIDGLDILAKLKEALNLSTLPKRIEGYDVSNIQSKFATGAMAVFTNGRPDKNEYRKFKIQTAGGDTGMLQEIMARRFNHPEWPYPDLILIDGGKGQLSAAKAAISNDKFQMTNEIPIIALTKNEKHIGDHILSTTRKAAVKIKNLLPAVRNLILQIDAEAHRFAISYYRKLHQIKTGLLSHDSSPAERLG